MKLWISALWKGLVSTGLPHWLYALLCGEDRAAGLPHAACRALRLPCPSVAFFPTGTALLLPNLGEKFCTQAEQGWVTPPALSLQGLGTHHAACALNSPDSISEIPSPGCTRALNLSDSHGPAKSASIRTDVPVTPTQPGRGGRVPPASWRDTSLEMAQGSRPAEAASGEGEDNLPRGEMSDSPQ